MIRPVPYDITSNKILLKDIKALDKQLQLVNTATELPYQLHQLLKVIESANGYTDVASGHDSMLIMANDVYLFAKTMAKGVCGYFNDNDVFISTTYQTVNNLRQIGYLV